MSADPQPTAAPQGPNASRSISWALLALFVGLAGWYFWLHARHYDGDAIKNAVWNRAGPHIADVNHPYPGVWFWIWWKLGSGFVGPGFDSRMAWLEALNGLLGAASATLAASALVAFGVRLRTAIGTGLILGLTHAWFYHSTQATEPIMAQFWLMLSLCCVAAIPRYGRNAAIASAFTWAVSVGAYQSYILAGFGLFWMICQDRRHIFPWLITSAVVGTSLYAGAAIGTGVRDLSGIIGYITNKPDGEYWGFIRPAALLQLPFGLANSLTPPWPVTREWPGLRLGWANLHGIEKAITAFIVVSTLTLTAAVVFLRVPESQRRLKWGLLLMFLAGMFGPFYLLPYYNKLWLLPLGALGLAAAVVADSSRRGWPVLIAVLALMVVRNTSQTYFQRSQSDNPLNRGAIALETLLSPKDLLISDGWDASNMYNARNPGRNIFRLIYQPVSKEKLANRIIETRQDGGRVYIFGLLELTPEKFAMSDVAKRGKEKWFPIIQSYQPKAKLVWRGQDQGVIGDLFEVVE